MKQLDNTKETTSKKCPDCGIYTLQTEKEINNNRCQHCNLRKRTVTELRVARGLDPKPYIPIKEASQEEKNIFYDKYNQGVSKKNNIRLNSTTSNTKSNANRYPEKFIARLNSFNNSNYTFAEIVNILDTEYPEYGFKTNTHKLAVLLNVRKINYKKQVKGNKQVDIKPENNVRSKYSDEFISQLRNWSFLTAKEILECIKATYPEYSEMKMQTLYYILKKYSIEYAAGVKPTRQEISQDAQDIFEITQTNKEDIESIITKSDLCDAEAEVNSILERKYKLMKCSNVKYYTPDEYINMLLMLRDLHDNFYTYINNGSKQHEIMNKYQADIVHEIENSEIEEGDNYLQQKLKKLRIKRRDCEYNQTYLNILKPFILNTNTEMFDKMIQEIKSQKQLREHPVYIPTVDMTIPEKYEWGKAGTLACTKSSDPVIKKEIQARRNLYRVSTKISGGGYKAFSPWYKDVEAESEEEAKQIVEGIMQLKNKTSNSSIYYSELQVHKLNK